MGDGMAVASGVLWNARNRILLGAAMLTCVVLAMMAAGRSFSLGFQLMPIYAAFLLAFLILGKELYFGFGSAKLRVACSYVIALSCILVAVYVLWYATDPQLAAQSAAGAARTEQSLP